MLKLPNLFMLPFFVKLILADLYRLRRETKVKQNISKTELFVNHQHVVALIESR